MIKKKAGNNEILGILKNGSIVQFVWEFVSGRNCKSKLRMGSDREEFDY